MRESLRVAIEAQISSGSEGGMEQVLVGLLYGLGQLRDGSEEYLVIGPPEKDPWLARYLAANQRMVSTPRPPDPPRESMKRLLGPLRKPAGILQRRLRRLIQGPPPPYRPTVPVSDGFYERLGADVLHITYPLHFVRADVPTVFSIYDLQHRHYPQFFDSGHLQWRETVYPAAFSHVQAVVADSEWVRQDLIQQYGTDPRKVFAIPIAPPTEAYPSVSPEFGQKVSRKFRLPEVFGLYPALTYPHKNHVRLLEAIAWLRDHERFRVHLVCTGTQKLFWPSIRARLRELSLERQVQFLGFVEPAELSALYHLAQLMIFPSLFEGAGLPLLEAFREGTPVACSDIPPLREYGQDAAFFFDPQSVLSIAQALKRLSTDAELRRKLSEAGKSRIRLFTWRRTAEMYRAIYRKVAGGALSEQDRQLLGV